MTPEELEAWKRRSQEKRKETIRKKKAVLAEATQKAQAMLPELIAQDILLADNQNYVPRQETLNKLKELLSDTRYTIEEARAKFFPHMKDEAWHRLTKHVFKSKVSQIEDVGLQLAQARERALGVLRDHVKLIKKEIRTMKREAKRKGETFITPYALLDRLMDAERRLFKLEEDYARTLHSVEAVGEKSKAPTLHLHMSLPRPGAAPTEPVVKDVSPPKSIQAIMASRRGSG